MKYIQNIYHESAASYNEAPVLPFFSFLTRHHHISKMKSFNAAAAAATTVALLSLPFLSSAAPTLLKRASGACSGACSGVHDPSVVISADGT